jgi:type IV pilus assembly protein PilO
MAGALSEFGKKTTGYKVGVFVAAAVVIGLLYFQFLYKKTKKSLTAARQDNQQLIDQSAKLDGDAKEYKKKLAEADQLNKQIEENQKALPTEAELPAFFDTLGRKVGEAQVEVRRWDYLKEIPIESYVKVPIEIEITGTFYQLKRFFSSLAQRDPVPTPGPDGTMQVEDRERIVTIENLQIYEPKIRNRELVLAAKFTASTFRQDAPVADKDKEDPKAKKPAGAGGAAPPANTPAGAKAATEGALKQGEARSTGSGTLQGGVP